MSSLRGLGWTLQDAILVASELATAAVSAAPRDANQWLELQVTREKGAVANVVSGPRGAPHQPAFDAMGTTILDQLTTRWGGGDGPDYRLRAEVPLEHGSS